MKNILIERYEGLRLFALGCQKTTIQDQNEYEYFIRKGMNACMIERAIDMPEAPTAVLVIEQPIQDNAFQPICKLQIMQTIADIILKRIKETPCYH